jgi:hypothetical protein
MSVQGAFARHARAFVEAALRRIAPAAARDAYVASLFVYDEHEDPTRPTAATGYNTEAAVTAAIARGVDPAAARWGYEHWLQNDLGTLAGERSDKVGARLRAHWLGELAARDGVTPFRAHGEDIADAFMALLAGVVRGLHRDGVVAEVFGRPVPVLIHGLVYDAATARHSRRANPDGLADPFAGWVNSLAREE